MKPAIKVDNLSKKYYLGQDRMRGYRTLRETVTAAMAAPWRRWRISQRATPAAAIEKNGAGGTEFYALKDVSFDVRPGEVVGIIGRNGAGKSTLLKVLSRITEPTSGHVEMRGRIASLLEVGTGFHPELTGRENIYLNGAVLGMSRTEIQRKFDQIVAFSEIEEFLDTPVKRYSSGMYVRLAFAVAAHLEPEILIVDEVLAVGDVAFQRKCLGRMHEVSRAGRTVFFVSHNMAAVESLCTQALLLDKGRLVNAGAVKKLVTEYYRRLENQQGADGASLKDAGGPHRSRRIFQHLTLIDESGHPTQYVPLGSCFRLRIGLQAATPIDEPAIGVGIDDTMAQRILTVHTPVSKVAISRIEGGCTIDCTIPNLPLAPGDYSIKLALSAKGLELDSIDRASQFTVVNADTFNDGRGFQRGLCVAHSLWEVREAE